MANEIVNLKPLQVPGEVLDQEDNGSKFEVYKSDGIYEYPILPNGNPSKSHVRITYKYGDVFEGNLKHGKQFGIGKYTWENGGHYEGNFKKGKLDGNGQYTAKNGDSYTGNFKNNRYDGSGVYLWADGSSFEGTFKDGQLLNGRYTDVNGNVYTCKYKYNRNGERTRGDIRLIKLGPKKEEHEEKPAKKETKETAAKKGQKSKNGLLNKDETLLRFIRKSARSAEFKNLYSGAAGKSEKSEKSLIAILNFFTNSDAEQIQRILKTSSIYDPTKGQEHYTNLITGVIKNSKNFASTAKSQTRAKQSTASSSKGGAAH